MTEAELPAASRAASVTGNQAIVRALKAVVLQQTDRRRLRQHGAVALVSFKNRVGFGSSSANSFAPVIWQPAPHESTVVDVTAQYLEAGVCSTVENGNVMLLENVAHVGLGKIDDGGGGLAEFFRRSGKVPVFVTDRQRSKIHQ